MFNNYANNLIKRYFRYTNNCNMAASTTRRSTDLLYDEETVVFEMLKDQKTNLLSLRTFLAALQETGLRRTDPRLKDTMANIDSILITNVTVTETQMIDLETFRNIAKPDIVLICNALRHQLVIPEFADFVKIITEIYKKCKSNTSGNVASYIPQLAKVNPAYWGVSVCTVDGQRFSVGDVNVPFAIQSCSKPFTYGLALDKLTESVVHQYIGHEPSGRNFNELVLDTDKKPHNPMINAGAILVCSLIQALINPEMSLPSKFEFTIDYFQRLAGNEHVGFNNSIFLSERETGNRNYALAYYMKEHNCFPEHCNFKDCLDFYFQCCSIETTCDTFAVVGATLANGGICPLTEEKVLTATSVRDVLSLMYSCGMYDYSGRFAFKIGVPAKSGVSGSLIIVIPNVMGICTFSPPLDSLGNSCKGIEFCKELTSRFNFHKYDILKHVPAKTDPRMFKFEERGLSVVHLLFCASHGDLYSLKRQRFAGMDMSVRDYDNRTALHLAAAEGHLGCVEFLVKDCGVPVDASDRWGHTPLSEAIKFEHETVAQFLQNLKKQ